MQSRWLQHQRKTIAGLPPFQGGIAGLFGYGLGELKQIPNPLYRLGITAVLCAAVGVVIYYWLEDSNLLGDEQQQMLFGVHLMLGIPFFYLLIFCGMVEESEAEIAALCVTLGLAMYLVKFYPARMPAASANGVIVRKC